MNDNYLLRATMISKRYPGVQALDTVDLEIKPGEVVGLVGENGAGKSTLVKIISGVIEKDSGQIIYKGEEINPSSPQAAQALGIITIHQELSLIPGLNVAQNLFLGHEPKKSGIFGFIDNRKLIQKTNSIFNDLSIHNIIIKKKIIDLKISEKQMVEISRAVSRDASLILMDEPTSSLADEDVKTLFQIIERLKARGVSVVFISHRLHEVIKIADRIIVLRDGQRSGTLLKLDIDEEKIIRLMVGRDVKLFPKEKIKITQPILEVKNISDKDFIKDISFSIKKGEIVGLAGLVGSGRSELAHILCGARKRETGQIFIHGKEVYIRNPKDAFKKGIVLVPEDRKSQGLVMLMSIKKNITLALLYQIVRFLNFINHKKQTIIANQYVSSLSIIISSIEKPVSTLSGGNQQKVVLAKLLSTNPKVLLLDEPTRGIDVGAKAEVHNLMNKLVDKGMGILMISSEMPEIIGMSDRILVMCQGRITGEIQ